MKRYIDMIIGFLIIIVIITPFAKLLHKDFNVDREIFKNKIGEIESLNKDNLNLSSTQEEQVKKIYISKIEGEISQLVHENTNYKVEKVNILIYEDKDKYGEIKYIELTIGEEMEKEREQDELIIVENVEEILIGKEERSLITMKEFDDDNEIASIISKNYNLPKENIRVFLNTTGEGELGGEVY